DNKSKDGNKTAEDSSTTSSDKNGLAVRIEDVRSLPAVSDSVVVTSETLPRDCHIVMMDPTGQAVTKATEEESYILILDENNKILEVRTGKVEEESYSYLGSDATDTVKKFRKKSALRVRESERLKFKDEYIDKLKDEIKEYPELSIDSSFTIFKQGHKKIHVCVHCRERVGGRKPAMTHLRQFHSEFLPWECPVSGCNQRESLRCLIERHLELHKFEGLYSCHLCPAKYKIKQSLTRHLESHRKNKKGVMPKIYKTNLSMSDPANLLNNGYEIVDPDVQDKTDAESQQENVAPDPIQENTAAEIYKDQEITVEKTDDGTITRTIRNPDNTFLESTGKQGRYVAKITKSLENTIAEITCNTNQKNTTVDTTNIQDDTITETVEIQDNAIKHSVGITATNQKNAGSSTEAMVQKTNLKKDKVPYNQKVVLMPVDKFLKDSKISKKTGAFESVTEKDKITEEPDNEIDKLGVEDAANNDDRDKEDPSGAGDNDDNKKIGDDSSEKHKQTVLVSKNPTQKHIILLSNEQLKSIGEEPVSSHEQIMQASIEKETNLTQKQTVAPSKDSSKSTHEEMVSSPEENDQRSSLQQTESLTSNEKQSVAKNDTIEQMNPEHPDYLCTSQQKGENDAAGHSVSVDPTTVAEAIGQQIAIESINANKSSAIENLDEVLAKVTKTVMLKLKDHAVPAYECNACATIISGRSAMFNHMMTSHKDLKIWSCHKCSYSTNSRSNLYSHEKHRHTDGAKYKCNRCGAGFHFPYKLRVHKSHCGVTGNNYCCQICGKEFRHPETYSSHLRGHCKVQRPQDTRKCEVCNKVLMKSNYQRHIESHIEGKQFNCLICSKSYKNPSGLREHQVSHKIMMHCAICNKNFTSAAWFRSHRRFHQVSGYQCQVCRKVFSSNGNLKQHTAAVHTNINSMPFKCKFCFKRFAVKKYLLNHMGTTHKTKRPYQCDLCPQSFSYPSGLNLHRMRHDRQFTKKLFHCDHCSRGFRTIEALSHHIRITHGDGKSSFQFSCGHCGKLYKSKAGIYKHSSIFHPNKEVTIKCSDTGEPFENVFMCEHCMEAFTSQDYLAVHILAQHLPEDIASHGDGDVKIMLTENSQSTAMGKLVMEDVGTENDGDKTESTVIKNVGKTSRFAPTSPTMPNIIELASEGYNVVLVDDNAAGSSGEQSEVAVTTTQEVLPTNVEVEQVTEDNQVLYYAMQDELPHTGQISVELVQTPTLSDDTISDCVSMTHDTHSGSVTLTNEANSENVSKESETVFIEVHEDIEGAETVSNAPQTVIIDSEKITNDSESFLIMNESIRASDEKESVQNNSESVFMEIDCIQEGTEHVSNETNVSQVIDVSNQTDEWQVSDVANETEVSQVLNKPNISATVTPPTSNLWTIDIMNPPTTTIDIVKPPPTTI
ncbi:unnamed protein product, partial [Owenia fusiformis]